MKKKLLTLAFTFALLIGLVAALGINASAATAAIDISAATGVSNYADLVSYLDQLRPKIYIKLTSDIIVTDDTKDLSLPVDASGTFVLDLNGYDIIINSDKTTSVFNVGSTFSTDFHVINSSATRSQITLNSITDGASVFYINDERSSLHVYEGIDIGVCLNGYYFGPNNPSVVTLCAIRANKFDTIALHGADIYNRSSYGIGIRFDSDASGSKLILDGNVEISSKNAALDFRGISTAYPTVTIKTLHAKYEDALPVIVYNYSTVDEYIAIKGMSSSTKLSDIAPSGTNGFYGTNADTSYSLFINDTDYINNSKYKGKNINISYPSCGHSQGYECYLRLFVPGQIRPLHFTVCSNCGKKAAYNTCIFVTEAEATSEAHGHTAGYDCYCGYKTAQTLHYYTEYAQKAATCTTSGNQETMYVCRICTTYYDSNKNQVHGKAFLQNRIDPLGHDMVEVPAVAATLTTDGNIAHYDCSRCDLISSDDAGENAITSTKINRIESVSLSATSLTYNAKVRTPSVTVKDSAGKVLVKDTDYTVTYDEGRRNVGTYNVKVTFMGNYSGSKTLSFKITPMDISKCTVKLSATSLTYNAKVRTPIVTITNPNGAKLTKDTHYTVEYSSGRRNVGTYDVTVTLKGNYKGSKTLSFKITPMDISKCTVKLSATSVTYNASVRTPSVTVTNPNGAKLTKDTHYTVTYDEGRRNVGTYNVTVKLKGNYTGTKTLSFKINPMDISKCSVKLSATTLTYNAKVRTPTVSIVNPNGAKLTKDTHYTVTYDEGRRNVGTYNVTVKLKGNYTGTKTLSFKINPMDISKCTVKLSATTLTYNAKVRTPTVSIVNPNGAKLTKDTHYTVTYDEGRRNVGTYNVTVKLKGNYTGTKTLSFTIKPMDISKCTVKLSYTSTTYNGNVRAPSVTVTNANGAKLTKDTHYTVTYASGRKNVGTYKVTVTMKGNYTGTKTLTFKINPPKTTVASLTAGTKSITVAVTKKTTQTTGYQIQYSTSKDFTNAKTKTITSNTTTKATLSSLTSAKTYYVRVRTYKTVNDVKYYSGWSEYKYVKTK